MVFKNIMRLFDFKKLQPVIIAFISLCVFIFSIFQFTQYNNNKKGKDDRDKLLEILVYKKSQLEKALYSRIYYTKGVAAYISINPGITKEVFDRLAGELIGKDTVINSMAISKDCILGAIYPFKGHESAIGLNLLEHPFRKKIVESTIKTGKTFVAGPVELVEGGVAFISYTPIFTKSVIDVSSFWGVADIVILKDRLFNEINLSEQDDNYKYSLRGVDGGGKEGACFWGDPNLFNNNPVQVDVLLPTGSWSLAGVPVSGWTNYYNKTETLTILLYISSFIISILIWLLAKAMVRIRTDDKELKALFGSMQNLVIVFNKHGEYVKIAPTSNTMLIKPANELLGRTLHQVLGKEEADLFHNAILECINTKKLVVLDYQLIINSENRWFQARISYLSDDLALYMAYDNTESKHAEEALKESEEKFRAIFENNSTAIAIIDHDTRISMVNDAYCEMGGYSRDEVIGMSWTEQIPPDELDRLKEYNRRRLINPQDAPEKYEFKFYRRDGELRIGLMSVAMIQSSCKIVAAFTDITERKKMEDQLVNYTEELKISNAAKDKFFSIIAHDLRGPFHGFLGVSNILAEEADSLTREETKEYSNLLYSALQKQYKLLTDLLDWSRLQNKNIVLNLEPVLLYRELVKAIESLGFVSNLKNIQIIERIEDNVFVTADKNILELILRNLISNGIKFTNQGGIIDISAFIRDKFVEVTVKDNGIGMSKEDLINIFRKDKYLSTEGTSNEKGSGLGLLLCKEFVEKQGGTIWVTSEEGQGSSFTFTIPIAM